MPKLAIVLGLALLVFGRKMFWIYMGAIGFVLGFELLPAFLPGVSDGVQLAVGLAGGAGGVVLALFAQKLMIIAAGFFGGGILAAGILELFVPGLTTIGYYLAFGIGALFGGAVAMAAFHLTLIIFSALLGSWLIVQGLGLQPAVQLLLMAGLTAGGIAWQLIQDGGSAKPAGRA